MALVIFMLITGITGAVLARNRGRNILGWGVLCGLFGAFLMVIYFQKPLREVRGGFKRCTACGEYIAWKSGACKYCGVEQPTPA